MCVFASVSTLTRLHDRLSTRDDVASFRPSKNLERPHEKFGATVAAPSIATAAAAQPLIGEVTDPIGVAPTNAPAAPVPSRAPPVR